ncbi:MAG: hypothetical protein WAT39_23955 [Planctomycetota bacterium]
MSDEPDDLTQRPCIVCGADCLERDFLAAISQFFMRGKRGEQHYLSRNASDGEQDESERADFIHRECIPLWAEGMFVRLESPAMLPGDA